MIEELLNYQVAGVALREVLTVEFLAGILGNVLAAIAILLAGFIIGAWLKRRIRGLGAKYEQL
ncbi:MAG: mechanosensitive ion channel family protein, partial [Rhodobacteraceae bacterium]|nr:mechanosensitive ion channel family protein [Paracoccaceae bacterium]